jgi:DNA-directed RNA polymerase subunit M/transcription elongation factor TFIIS
MVDYNALINKKMGVIPIRSYRVFFKKFGKFLKTTNQHSLLSYHTVNCSQCGYSFPKEALMFLTTEGTKRMTQSRKVVSSDENRFKRISAGKCPKCNSTSMKIRIQKLQIESLSGKYNNVFVCGEVSKVTRDYQKAEDKFVKWVETNQKGNFSPSVQIKRLQYRKLPRSDNSKAVDAFVQNVQSKKGVRNSDYKVKIYNQKGYHFIVLYMR